VLSAAKSGIATPTAEEQSFTQSRVSHVALHALVIHLGNAAVARVSAADAVATSSEHGLKSSPAKGTVSPAALVSAAVSSPPAEIIRGLIVELDTEVRG
jgi:hypothetical protein